MEVLSSQGPFSLVLESRLLWRCSTIITPPAESEKFGTRVIPPRGKTKMMVSMKYKTC